MKIKNISLLLLMVIFSLTLVSFVQAVTTVSFNLPATNGIVANETLINVTISSMGDAGNTDDSDWNCSIYVMSTSTANSTWSHIMDILNSSTEGAESNINISSMIEDSNDYIFNATCFNGTDGVGTLATFIDDDLVTGVVVDNFRPSTPGTLSPADATIDADGSVTFSCAVIGNLTTGCTLFFNHLNPGSQSYSMTHSGDTCTHTLSAVPDQTYVWFIGADDGTNQSNSTALTLNVDVTTSAGKAAKYISEGVAEPRGGALLSLINGMEDSTFVVIAVLIIGTIVYFVWYRK